MRTTTLTHPATDLFGRAIEIAQQTFAGGNRPTSVRRPARAPSAPHRSLLDRLDGWFERQEQRERESYLGQSQDIFELERRIRHLERRGWH
jgi:hypothetical protein